MASNYIWRDKEDTRDSSTTKKGTSFLFFYIYRVISHNISHNIVIPILAPITQRNFSTWCWKPPARMNLLNVANAHSRTSGTASLVTRYKKKKQLSSAPLRKRSEKNTHSPSQHNGGAHQEQNGKLTAIISNSLTSSFYHQDKSEEFQRHAEKGRYPSFLYSEVSVRYRNDFSSELQKQVADACCTFARTMCNILVPHHESMRSSQDDLTQNYIAMARKRYPGAYSCIVSRAETLDMDKQIKYKGTREGPTTGNKRKRELP